MDKEKYKDIKDKVLRWQLLADQWHSENKNVFIKTMNNNIYFCKVVMVGETRVSVDVYSPEQRAGTREVIDWLQIVTFDEVKEKGE